MTTVRDDVRLHESTVQKIARDGAGHKRTRAAGRRLAITTRSVRVDGRVMEAARRIRDGQGGYTRIEILDSETVVVR